MKNHQGGSHHVASLRGRVLSPRHWRSPSTSLTLSLHVIDALPPRHWRSPSTSLTLSLHVIDALPSRHWRSPSTSLTLSLHVIDALPSRHWRSPSRHWRSPLRHWPPPTFTWLQAKMDNVLSNLKHNVLSNLKHFSKLDFSAKQGVIKNGRPMPELKHLLQTKGQKITRSFLYWDGETFKTKRK